VALNPRKICPICGGERLERFHAFRWLNRHAQMRGYQEGEKPLTAEGESEPLAICGDCHGLFRENVIDYEALFANYNTRSAEQPAEEVKAHLEAEHQTYLDGNEKYVGEVAYICAHTPEGSRILDIGSREGVIARALGGKGFDVTVIEPTEAFTSALTEHFGVKTKCGFFEKGAFPDESFDLITACNVLHRVDEVDAFISAAHDQLAEGGQVLLCTNNAYQLAHNYLTQQHRIFFTPRSVEIMLNRQGFEVADSLTVNWNGIPRLFTLAKKVSEKDVVLNDLDAPGDLTTGLLRAEFGLFPPFGMAGLHGPLLRLAASLGFGVGRLVRHLDRVMAKVRGL